ncbi:MAG: hypothetical protein IKJ93_04720 [Clostridia bacterium]|nr:hypothetical protein [Clostridia bacterium]
MIICKICGHEFSDFKFCPNCGTEVASKRVEIISDEVVLKKSKAKNTGFPGEGKGIAALVMGILSLINSLSGFGIVFAVIGIVLGSLGVKESVAFGFENDMGKIGKILSIIGLIISVICLAIITVCLIINFNYFSAMF